MIDRVTPNEMISANVQRGAGHGEQLRAIGRYDVVCIGPDGREKWRDVVYNLVTTVGKNDFLDKYLRASGYTQTMRMGLKGTGTAAAGDTQASHSGWSEVGGTNAPAYTGNRPSITFNSASAGSSSSPSQSFSITSSGTVAGVFMNNGGSATKDDTTGVLFSAGDFSGGSKTVANGDMLNVTYTLSV